MKIRLKSIRLRDPLDSVEPLNSTALDAKGGWILTWDTSLQVMECILTHRSVDADGQEQVDEKWRGETPTAGCRSWVRAAEQSETKGAKS